MKPRLRMIAWGTAILALSTMACTPGSQTSTAGESDSDAPLKNLEGYESGGEDMSGPYEVDPAWPKPLGLPGLTWGRTAAVYAESPDRVFVVQSWMLPILEDPPEPLVYYLPSRSAVDAPGQVKTHVIMTFDREGNLVEHWKQWDHLFSLPHRIATNPWDPERPIWVADNTGNQVFKFSNDGEKLLMKLGEPEPGNDDTHFHGPNAIAFLPNGDFFIVESYHRVTKWSKDGKLLLSKDTIGTGPGEFGNLHTVAVDAEQRVYISDWGRTQGQTQVEAMRAGADLGRIQVFDKDLNYLDEWPHLPRISSIQISTDQSSLFATDDTYNKVIQLDLETGRLLSSWGTMGARPGNLWGPHDLSTDSEGNLYIPEIYNGRVQKFRPRPGADPSRLIGPLYKEHLE